MPFWRRDVAEIVDVAIGAASTFVVRQSRRYRDLVEVGEREMVHTRVLVDAPDRSGFAYTDAMHAATALCATSAPLRALCLGGGGGIIATQLARRGAEVDLVERSELVLRLAHDHFGLRPSASLVVHHDDAARSLAGAPAGRFDAVFVDLFGAFEASPLVVDPAFFADVARVLRPGGAVAVNTVGSLGGDSGAMLATERALAVAFPEVLALPLLFDHERKTKTIALEAVRNVVIFASPRPFPARLSFAAARDDLPAADLVLDDLNRRLHALATARSQGLRRCSVLLPPQGSSPRRHRPASATSSARFATPNRM